MSQSNIQVLLHQGELLHIVEAISNSNGQFVGGCLFGLWRNSLKQPVIQFVTCPGRRERQEISFKDIFDSNYNRKCAEILMEDHAMLKLGYWFSGTDQEQNKALEYFGHSSDKLLLFIRLKEGRELQGEFYLKKDRTEDHGSLYREDVLPDQSSFRLHEPLTIKIKEAGTNYPTQLPDVKEKLEKLLPFIQALPSRAEVRDPETKEEQWYSGEDGVALLQKMVESFKNANIEVEMSRDAVTHNIQFTFNGGFCLDFPLDFPKRMPLLTDPRGDRMRTNYDYKTAPDHRVVDAVCRHLQQRSSHDRY